MTVHRPTAAIILPCLNEAGTLGTLLDQLQKLIQSESTAQWSILVSDNGSTDGSADIARKRGIRVIESVPRGYGAAIRAAVAETDADWIVYLDADGTYLPHDALRLLRVALQENADLVLGTRIGGEIAPGAMPRLHRYLGTPLLTFLIRMIHGARITDCNSGVRCMRRDAFLRWNLRCTGMEFASEMLIRAAQQGAEIREVPVSLLPNPPGRRSHLRPYRDGWNHLRIVLSPFWPLSQTGAS